MEPEYSLVDTSKLLQAASDFSFDPGTRSEAAVKEFLGSYPLPVIINALQTNEDVPGLEDALIDCLEKIFRTKYGASLIPQYMPFIVVGLQAYSQRVRNLSCKTISSLLENLEDTGLATSLIKENGVYPLLLNCLIDGDEQVAVAATDAIRDLSRSQHGIKIIFPDTPNEATDITNLAAKCSSLGRVRVLALIVKLFSTSNEVASLIHNSNLLALLEAEVRNVNDTLITLSVLELLYELAEAQHGMEYVLQTNILQLLISIIRNSSAESMLRSRAMMISGRLLSKENVLMFIDESSIKAVISAIDERLSMVDNSQDADECECGLEAMGQLGSSTKGAVLVMSNTSAARRVINAAFDLHGRGRQLAALHSLGNIVGETRPENNKLLNADSEETLKRLIYETASNTPKLIPSGLVLSILKLESEFRIAGYRLISGLTTRPWFLVEICSRQEIINKLTDSFTETTKIGMEARYNCCEAVYKALSSSSKLVNDPALSGTAEKLVEAIKKGPYLGKGRQREAQPEVATADRF